MLIVFIVMKGQLNPPLNVGDEVVCFHMEHETTVPPGTKGVVTKIQRDPFEESDDALIISVNWENGSKLSLVSTTDAWKSAPSESIKEQKDPQNEYEYYEQNPDIFKNFDWKFFREYMDVVRESGVVNVFAASPLLYSGKNHIERYYGENPPNPEEFDKLLDMADEAKDKMIQGTMSWMENNDKEIDVDTVNYQIQKLSKKILQLWRVFYQ